MEQVDFTNYKLEGKNINHLAFLMHKKACDQDFITSIIYFFGLENLVKTKNNGLISNILNYYINSNDDVNINQLIYFVSKMNDFSLMKRDYLQLINYYYSINRTKATELFFNKILSRVYNNTESVIQTKDIDYMIKNNLFDVIKNLNGTFVSTSIMDYPLNNPNQLELQLFNLNLEINNFIIQTVETEIKPFIDHLIKFIKTNDKSFGAIIDAGNVLHFRKGNITQQSLFDLKTIIHTTKMKIGEPLLIIHQRHFKNIPSLGSLLKTLDVSYYQTPYKYNDDNFILWFFLKFNTKPYIITNDKYRDHIFKLETSQKSSNSELSWSVFKHIIEQQITTYNLETDEVLGKIQNYSNCIQIIDNKIMIPHISGNFIELLFSQ